MILKSKSRTSNANPKQLCYYLVRYSLKEKRNEHGKEKATIILRHNLRSRTSIEKMAQEFIENESYRLYKRKRVSALYHDIISFNPQDRPYITDDLLKAMAKKYVELRGTNNLYLIVAHQGKTSHTHLHAICSGVSLAGRSSRVSKAGFRKIKIELENFQREHFPQLIASRNNHTRQSRTKEAIIETIKKSRQTKKQSLVAHLEQAYSEALSADDFSKRLATGYFEPYYRDGKLQGVVADGKKYRLSRLGFDVKTVQELDSHTATLHRSLRELQAIRTDKNRKREQPMLAKPAANTLSPNQAEQKQLQELCDIRNRSAARDIEGRTNEDDHFERALESDNIPTNFSETSSLFPLNNRLLLDGRSK